MIARSNLAISPLEKRDKITNENRFGRVKQKYYSAKSILKTMLSFPERFAGQNEIGIFASFFKNTGITFNGASLSIH